MLIGQGRTGRRVADLVAALLPLVIMVVTGLLVRAGFIHEVFILANMFSLGLDILVLVYIHAGWHVQVHDGTLLSVRTLTGRRTVDLFRLVKVGRVEVVGQGPTEDKLILTDAHGVRVVVNRFKGGRATVDATVRKALLCMPAAGVTVSARAAERLNLETQVLRRYGRFKPGRRIPFKVIAFAPLLLAPVYCVLSFALTCGSILLADV